MKQQKHQIEFKSKHINSITIPTNSTSISIRFSLNYIISS